MPENDSMKSGEPVSESQDEREKFRSLLSQVLWRTLPIILVESLITFIIASMMLLVKYAVSWIFNLTPNNPFEIVIWKLGDQNISLHVISDTIIALWVISSILSTLVMSLAHSIREHRRDQSNND